MNGFNPLAGPSNIPPDNAHGISPPCLGEGANGPRCAPCSFSKTCDNLAAVSSKQVAGTHYKDMGVQPWDVVDTWPIEQRIGYYRGSALKYLMRMGAKDESAQEIEKGIHCLEKLVLTLKEQK